MVLRRLVLLGWLGAAGIAPAQTDDRAAQLAARYEAMLAANPAEGIALERLWKSAEERGATAELLERHRTGDPLVYGHLLKRAGRLDDAAAAYRQAQDRDPRSPLPPFALGDLAAARTKPAEAAGFYDTAVANLPADDRRQTDWLLKLGAARLAAGQPREAAESWERIVARRPGDAALRRQLAQTYEANRLTDQAIGHYEYLQAHAEPADRLLALRDLARLRELRGEFEPARAAFEQGLALTARDHWLHAELQTGLIRLYERAGRAPELAARWEGDAQKAPRDLAALERLEALAREQGEAAAQRRWLEKIVALAPGDRESARDLARLLADAGERERTAGIYDALLKTRPADLDLTLARAELDVQLNRLPAAADRVEALAARTRGDDTIAAAALEFFLRYHLDAPAERRLRADVAARPNAEEPALALARFLFARLRPTDGAAALNAMVGQTAEPAAKADRLSQAAEVYRQSDQWDDAVRCWLEAAKLAPTASAPLLAAADALSAHGDVAGAAKLLRQAIESMPPGAPRDDADRRLFQVLTAAAPPERRREASQISPPTAPDLERLGRLARDTPSAANWLRLARWQSWAHSPKDAADSAARAAALDPASVPAHELLASLAAENGDRQEAARQYTALGALDPEHKSRWLREVANLQISDGDFDRALGVYEELARLSPGSLSALTDLALAQQRAEHWYDAQTTWERAYALPGATPQQRAEVRRPLLAALDRLGEAPRAAELLQAAVDSAGDPSERSDNFHQLVDFSAKHGLTAALEKQIEERLAAQPLDYFLLSALAELRRAAGRQDEAYALLGRAVYSAPDQAAALRGVVEAGEALGNLDGAIADQRRLVALSRPAPAEASEKLASLQMANLDDEAAAATWDDLAARFPRDAGVLGRAADFFESIDQPARARTLLRALAAFDPADLPRVLRLGELDAAAGDRPAAYRSFQEVIAHTEPEKPGDSPQLPPLASAGKAASTPSLRLRAIRGAAGTLPAAARPEWIAHWSKAADAGGRNEPLWAFFFADAKRETSDLLARWAAERPGNEAVEGTLINVELRLGNYRELAAWTWAEPDRAERLLLGLAQFLSAGGEPEPRLLPELFPPGCSREVRWKVAALVFAGRQRFAQAVTLGLSVFGEVSANRANYAMELARWYLCLGQAADARAILRQAIDEGGSDTLEITGDQYFAALREYWLLLPLGERAAFTEASLRRASGPGGPAQAVLARAVLHGLTGQELAAEADLDQLIKLRMLTGEPGAGSPDARRWAYLLANGAQLAAWNLDAMAIHLWRRALDGASAFQWRDPECRGVLAELRGRLAGAQILTATTPQDAAERLDDYLRSQPEPAEARTLAAQLLAGGRPASAARVHDYLLRADHADPDNGRNLLDAYAAAGDHPALQRTLRQLLEAADRPAGLTPPELAARLAAELERDGDQEGARRVLARHWLANPRAVPLGLALARSNDQAGRPEEAAAVLRELLPNENGTGIRLELSALELRRGHSDAGVALLKEAAARTSDPGHIEAAARLIELSLASGDRAAALALAREPQAAIVAAQAHDRKPVDAKALLTLGLKRATDSASRFAAQSALLAFANPDEFMRGVRWLKRFARSDPGWMATFENTRFEQARKRGLDAWLEGELRAEWKDGRGDATAGARLVDLFLQTRRDDSLREVVKALADKATDWEGAAMNAHTTLVTAGRAELAIPLIERLARRFPQNEKYATSLVVARWKAGRPAEAETAANELSATGVIREKINERLAAAFEEVGAAPLALEFYQRALDPGPETFLAMARLELRAGNLAAARGHLRAAYGQSETADLTLLVDWLEAAGQLDNVAKAPGANFPLTVAQRGRLAVAVFDRLVLGGKTAPARQLALAHPELLAASPELAGRLRGGATAAERPAIGAALELALAQGDPPAPRLERELAEWCVEGAAADPTLLDRAHALRPQDFSIARKLAERCLAARQPDRAAQALQAFVTPEALPEERRAAQEILARK